MDMVIAFEKQQFWWEVVILTKILLMEVVILLTSWFGKYIIDYRLDLSPRMQPHHQDDIQKPTNWLSRLPSWWSQVPGFYTSQLGGSSQLANHSQFSSPKDRVGLWDPFHMAMHGTTPSVRGVSLLLHISWRISSQGWLWQRAARRTHRRASGAPDAAVVSNIFWFSPRSLILGEMIKFDDHMFQLGWNQQLA